VVKTREAKVLLVVFEDVVMRERDVSGPESVKGADTFKVRVYGGP
jgi:hypothetical protein